MKRNRLFCRLLAGTLTAALSMTPGLSVLAEEDIVIEAIETAADDAAEILSEETNGSIVVEEAANAEVTIRDTVPDITIEEISTEADGIVIEDSEIVDSGETEELPEPTRVTVHDPSIVKSEDGTYYVLGSHTASASSADLIEWTQINFDYGSPENTPFYGNLREVLAEPFEWAGYNDGDCTGGYAIWAPDAIWNPYYEWEDGSTGAYMLYCCTSSTWRRSAICCLVSKEFNGAYEYVDTIVYSGFTLTGETDGSSTRNTKWDSNYLNLTELIEKGSENGGIDEISDNWFTSDGGWNNLYAPNAIDPNLFFDAEGEKLYMSYGSWSGGLFLLELDRTTGAAIYPGVDSVDEVSGNYVDRYFGVHLIGGNHQSGEAPYIQYDEETGYYYMYVTYGGLTAEGGYNMRLFRSENVTGPYLDAQGGNAADNGENNDAYGIKLIGNYSFYDQIGKRAAGHNSALIDDDGSRYLVYHQRFDIEPQLEAHEVRVHQQFMNEDLWPVTAVYEYRGETPEHYEDIEVVGSYEFINHGTATEGTMLETQMLTLYENGTIDGAAAGTWAKSDSGKGYDYVTFTMDDGTVYKGVFFRQHKENSDPDAVMTFTAIGTDNTSIWGSMVDMDDPEMVVGMAGVSISQMMPRATKENLDLPTSVMGAEIVWTSEDESVIAADGTVTPQTEDIRVKLTASITCGEASLSETYKVIVRGSAALICGYDFETVEADGTIAPTDGSSLEENAVPAGDAAVIADETRGNVLEVKNEPGAKGVNYLQLPSDTLRSVSSSGYSVAMWTKIGAETFEHSALFEADANGAYPLTRIGANLIARINANNYSDVMGSLLTTSGQRDVWQHIVYTVDPYGIKVYLNGELIGEENKDIADCFRKNSTGISQAKNVMVGSGCIWDDEDCQNALFDDVLVYDGVLSAAEVKGLFEKE